MFLPFKLIYGQLPPCLGNHAGNLHQVGDKGIREQLQLLGTTLNELQRYTIERAPISLVYQYFYWYSSIPLLARILSLGQELTKGTS